MYYFIKTKDPRIGGGGIAKDENDLKSMLMMYNQTFGKISDAGIEIIPADTEDEAAMIFRSSNTHQIPVFCKFDGKKISVTVSGLNYDDAAEKLKKMQVNGLEVMADPLKRFRIAYGDSNEYSDPRYTEYMKEEKAERLIGQYEENFCFARIEEDKNLADNEDDDEDDSCCEDDNEEKTYSVGIYDNQNNISDVIEVDAGSPEEAEELAMDEFCSRYYTSVMEN